MGRGRFGVKKVKRITKTARRAKKAKAKKLTKAVSKTKIKKLKFKPRGATIKKGARGRFTVRGRGGRLIQVAGQPPIRRPTRPIFAADDFARSGITIAGFRAISKPPKLPRRPKKLVKKIKKAKARGRVKIKAPQPKVKVTGRELRELRQPLDPFARSGITFIGSAAQAPLPRLTPLPPRLPPRPPRPTPPPVFPQVIPIAAGARGRRPIREEGRLVAVRPAERLPFRSPFIPFQEEPIPVETKPKRRFVKRRIEELPQEFFEDGDFGILSTF